MSREQVECYVKLCIMFVLFLRVPRISHFLYNVGRFLGWKLRDMRKALRYKRLGIKVFPLFGLRMFCGRQGAGKTMAMVLQLEQIRQKYPKCQIYTNFGYAHETAPLECLDDILRYRNGDDGVVFALDEIQNEFSSAASKNFPETLLSTITMQRKQKIAIFASSQVFTRVAKPLREQCYEIVECRTFAKRWTRMRCYDADDYNAIIDSHSPEKKFKLPKLWKESFVQTDELRELFDSYALVDRLSRQGFRDKEEAC